MELKIKAQDISLDSLVGNWKNSKPTTEGISSFTLIKENGQLFIELTGAQNGFLPGNWGKFQAKCYAKNTESKICSAFQSACSIGNKSMILAGNINKGLIIIATYIEALDNSDESNFFIREFFYKLK